RGTSLTVSATWLTDKPRTIGPEARAPSCARVEVGNANAANAWTRCRRVIRPRSYWSNNESTMEFISGTSRCNHCRSERLPVGVRGADDKDGADKTDRVDRG